MSYLAKYLKGSAGTIVLIIALLALQAWCDLELPNYTSRIVTGGIQQKGVADPVPEEISRETMDNIALLADEESFTAIRDSYEQAEDGSLYTLRPVSSADRQALAGLLTDPEAALLMTASPDALAAMSEASAAAGDPAASDEGASWLSSLPEGTTPLDALRKLPSLLRKPLLSKFKEALAAMPASTKEQMAIQFVLSEYERLGEDPAVRQNRYLFSTGIRMLALAFVAMLCTICVVFLAARMAAGTARRLRSDVYSKVMTFNNEEFHHFSTASLITRSTNDIQQVQMLLAVGLRMLLYAPIIGIGAILKVVQTEVSISWVIALAVFLILVLILILFKVAMPKFTILQTLIDRLNLVSREQLTGIMVTRAFSAEQREEERFDAANRDLTRTTLFVNRAMTIMMPAMMLILNGISVLIVYTGAHEIDAGSMQVGDMMAFIQYAMQIIMAFLMISMMSIIIPRANVAARRIAEVLKTQVRLSQSEHPVSPSGKIRGQVVFDHVSFAYPDADENVLTDISFTAEEGQTIAFIGSTGSGKSTLINLIPRFYDATEGSVRVDGVDVRDMSKAALCERIGYVPQKSVLFSGTIASNIGYGIGEDTSAAETEDAIARAASIAQAAEFIESREDRYASPIAQGGTNVSGGQRQRLSIARAIAKNPEILIFDDSFSALDFKTDAALRKALKENTVNTTVLIVAQRISTIVHADKIIVLDEGRIAGQGTHRELMETCEVYRQIATSQLSQEELAG